MARNRRVAVKRCMNAMTGNTKLRNLVPISNRRAKGWSSVVMFVTKLSLWGEIPVALAFAGRFLRAGNKGLFEDDGTYGAKKDGGSAPKTPEA